MVVALELSHELRKECIEVQIFGAREYSVQRYT